MVTPVVSPASDASLSPPDFGDSSLYINRELSSLRFQQRVLGEALDSSNPLLERVKFLSILASNLDEFFMIRVSGLRGQLAAGVVESPPDGMTPNRQLTEIREFLTPMLARADDCWRTEIQPQLSAEGIHVLGYDDLRGKQRKLLRKLFKSDIFPVLTPLAFDPGHPFPHISNLCINLAVVIGDRVHGEKFARLKVPQSLPRLLPIPDEEAAAEMQSLGLDDGITSTFVWIEEVVAANLDLLFPGVEILDAFPFRVTRDADLDLEEDEAADLLTSMAEVIGRRHFGSAIRLEIDDKMPDRVRDILVDNLRLAPFQVYSSGGQIGQSDLMQLTRVERSDLKDGKYLPYLAPHLADPSQLYQAISERDHLLYHPYDSFAPVIDFVRQAASDPEVVAIKQTLYRTGPDSPIVQALMEARQNGKQVSVLVELKARFDEESNIGWARALEDVGVHVVYGVVGLKTHAKMCLVVRRGRRGVSRFVHLSTGNYNAVTARVYTDFGLLTTDPEIAQDVSDLFNALTGYSRKEEYRKLLVAPTNMRAGILERIDREIELHRHNGGGHIVFKLNALVDKRCIEALYRASSAGVKVDLQVRGICCLRPGVPGVSENIEVTSVVGRFLEHTRIYYFRNGGDTEILTGSADLMPRNLDGRVELLFPIAPALRPAIEEILFLHLGDNQQSWVLQPEGDEYEHRQLEPGEAPVASQEQLLSQGGSWRSLD